MPTLFVRDRSFYRTVVKIAIPISLQSMITIGVNMMDNIMVGSLGETALSAVSLSNAFIHVFQIFCMGIGMGASVLTSRYWGMQDLTSLRKVVTIMLRLVLGIGGVFTLATILAPGLLMRIYTPEADIIAEGIRNYRWSIPCYYLLGFSLTCTIVLRSTGQVRLPLYSSIAAFFVNIFFNWVFIYGNLGAPRMGVAGAALGTLISRSVEFAVICGFFFLREERIRYRIRNLKDSCRGMLGTYLKVSFPVLVSDGLLALGNSAVAIVMGHIGSGFVSANAITTVTQQLSTVLITGMSNASAIITGHTLGEGDPDKAQRQGVTFLTLGVIVGVFAGGLIMIFSKTIIGLYNITPETQAIAEQLMLAVGFMVIFQAANSILTKGVLRGGGATRFLMVADILFLWVASIPRGAVAGLVWHLPAFWTYVLLRIEHVIKAFLCVYRLKSRKWIKHITPSTAAEIPTEPEPMPAGGS